MDKIIETFGGIKGYEIAQASNLLGLTMSKLLFNYKYDEDKDIKEIMDYLVAYDLSEHYDTSIRQVNYSFFKSDNLPATIKIVKNAVNRGVVDKKNGYLCLICFLKSVKSFLKMVTVLMN